MAEQGLRSQRELSMGTVLVLVFVPPALLMVFYLLLGHQQAVQTAIPSQLLFFLLALAILFPIELAVVLIASKKEYGSLSLKSAFTLHQPLAWWKVALFAVLPWAFMGVMSVTLLPLETALWAPVADRAMDLLPPYFDWTNIDYLRQFPRDVLLLTVGVYVVLNVFAGPIIEELFFRGYLTAKISRFGNWAPLIMTVLFSLYHFWLPFHNLFRIVGLLPAFYLTWKKQNIYIAIVVHCMANLVSTLGFIAAVQAIL
jgi:uncharacterized protein